MSRLVVDIERNKHYVVNEQTGCWEWQKAKTSRGYGCMNIKSKYWGAHRYSYLYFKGEFDLNLHVCHTCDNPSCINPNHLFLGTHSDNMRDKVKKGRHDYSNNGKHKNHVKGEKHFRARVSDKRVGIIRKLYRTGNYYQKDLAFLFNTTQSTVGKIIRGETRC